MAAMTMIISYPGFSKSGNPGAPVTELKYIGKLKENPVFLLSMNNPENDVFVINIRDVYGNIIFREKLSGTAVTRKYAFSTEDEVSEPLRIEVVSKNNPVPLIFEIRTEEKQSTDVRIQKIS